MIIALAICNFCFIFILEGVHTWCEYILACINAVCLCVASIIWEQTKLRIRSLEKRLDKTKGGVDDE
jgi:hypothetical protein